jgi:hypothetical protein
VFSFEARPSEALSGTAPRQVIQTLRRKVKVAATIVGQPRRPSADRAKLCVAEAFIWHSHCFKILLRRPDQSFLRIARLVDFPISVWGAKNARHHSPPKGSVWCDSDRVWPDRRADRGRGNYRNVQSWGAARQHLQSGEVKYGRRQLRLLVLKVMR